MKTIALYDQIQELRAELSANTDPREIAQIRLDLAQAERAHAENESEFANWLAAET